jgi:hypothetical protein
LAYSYSDYWPKADKWQVDVSIAIKSDTSLNEPGLKQQPAKYRYSIFRVSFSINPASSTASGWADPFQA